MPAVIFNGIVQKRGDRHLFIAAVVYDERANPEQVRDVGLAGALAHIMAMQVVSKPQGFVEFRAKTATRDTLRHAKA
jgi:hypothetical protein